MIARPSQATSAVIAWLFSMTALAHGATTVDISHIPPDAATPAFQFESVPRPARNDAATRATFTIVTGQRDSNGGQLAALHDGILPAQEDHPSANFFFRAGTDGGRLLLDLGSSIALKQVNTFSWHPGGRGPQVYTLYVADGQSENFNPQPGGETDPLTAGWTLLANVDTRTDQAGGQFGVSISNPTGDMGQCRYLLFDVARTDAADPFGHTFFSEIDVVDRDGPSLEFVEVALPTTIRETVTFADGQYTVVIDTSGTPDLTEWTQTEIIPMVREWYPKLVDLLPSQDFRPPTRFSILFDPDMRGVAATSGTRIRCAATWIRSNLKGESKGAIFHEMVHVVQQYGRARGSNRDSRPPGWLVEGLTDYLRWYHFEPQSRGAEITQRNLDRARYDGSYRITANFLNWICQQHGEDFIPKLNAAIREGRYHENLWIDRTGHSVQDLGAAWKTHLENELNKN